MPNWSEILGEISEGNQLAAQTESPIDRIRRKYLKNLQGITKRNIIIYYSGWLQQGNLPGTEINDDDKNGFMSAQYKLDTAKGLDLILHTPGGETGATESIVDYLHSLYQTDIRAFIPQLALSGGTIIACGCEVIYMGKHSSLGPIDPQISGIPAHGVIEEFKQAYEEIQKDKDKALVWQPILSRYNPTLIHSSQKIIEMNQEMVIKWLKTGMFKEDPQGVKKSKRIAKLLTDTNYTK